MTHGSLFSGIGGFDLAAHWMGWTNVFHVERDPFCQQVLKHHFPEAHQHHDIRDFNATQFRGRISVLSGGFPCQPWSTAGKRKGTADQRDLWSEMHRVIRECAPRYVVGENVRGLASWNGGVQFEQVCADLESSGYAVQPFFIPACAVNAPHQRMRCWFVAHADDKGRGHEPGTLSQEDGEVPERNDDAQSCNAGSADAPNTDSKFRPEGRMHTTGPEKAEGHVSPRNARPGTWEDFPSFAPICGRDDGLPNRLDGITISKWRRESLKAYGNAIVPQVALELFKAIEATDAL